MTKALWQHSKTNHVFFLVLILMVKVELGVALWDEEIVESVRVIGKHTECLAIVVDRARHVALKAWYRSDSCYPTSFSWCSHVHFKPWQGRDSQWRSWSPGRGRRCQWRLSWGRGLRRWRLSCTPVLLGGQIEFTSFNLNQLSWFQLILYIIT